MPSINCLCYTPKVVVINMNMLFRQKLAAESGKKPHCCAIEYAC